MGERRPGDRQRIDRVRLAIRPCRVPGVGHQLRWHPAHQFTSAQQVAFEKAGQMPAVLDRPYPFRAELVSPDPQPGVLFARGFLGRDLAELAAEMVDRDDGVGALVRIDPQCHHDGSPFFFRVEVGRENRSVGHISVGAMPRSYQATPAGSFMSEGRQNTRWPQEASPERAKPPDHYTITLRSPETSTPSPFPPTPDPVHAQPARRRGRPRPWRPRCRQQ